LASILNKLPEGIIFPLVVNIKGQTLESVLQNLVTEKLLTEVNSMEINVAALSVENLIWITKALVMRGHPLGLDLGKQLIAKLASPIGSVITNNFALILLDLSDVLNQASDCVIKVCIVVSPYF
jgi:hypothetical protein